ncbi:MAG TPA: hypothetical protein VF383_07355 [Candidatus Dormibacteraeota bacterium]
MGDWNLFFATSAGSAATLVGLLFVATQLHIDVFKDPKNRWAALAQSTLTILSTDFALSLFFLMPGLSPRVHGEVIAIVVAFVLFRTVRIWWPVVRLAEKGRRHRVAQSFWLLILPFIVYGYLTVGAIQLLNGQVDGVPTVASAFLTLFAVALRNSWRLVVSPEN